MYNNTNKSFRNSFVCPNISRLLEDARNMAMISFMIFDRLIKFISIWLGAPVPVQTLGPIPKARWSTERCDTEQVVKRGRNNTTSSFLQNLLWKLSWAELRVTTINTHQPNLLPA